MSRPRLTVALGAAAFVVLAALLFGPALTRERQPVASTAAPSPFFGTTPIDLRQGQQLCAEDILIPPDAKIAQMVMEQPADRPSPPLEVRLSGPGYDSAPSRVEPGIAGGTIVYVDIDPPDREVFGRLCVRNLGRTSARLVGTTEFRTQAAQQASVDGEPIAADLTLTFLDDRRVSALAFLPEIVDRMTTFRAFLGAEWLLWLLLVLVVVGVPAAAFYALYRALAGGDPGR